MLWNVKLLHRNPDGSKETEIIQVHGFALREWRGKNTTICKTIDIWPACEGQR